MMKRRNCREGFSLVELLVSLVLLSILMASVAAAVRGSLLSYETNEDVANVTHSARAVLERMLGEIRAANAIDPNAGSDTIRIEHPRASESDPLQETEYTLDSGSLKMKTYLSGALQGTYVLLGGLDDVTVTTFSFTPRTGQDQEGKTCIVAVTVAIELSYDGQTINSSGSSYLRRKVGF
jgi:prepilin-type N-terminal cleavage/methylation domain-containing protein